VRLTLATTPLALLPFPNAYPAFLERAVYGDSPSERRQYRNKILRVRCSHAEAAQTPRPVTDDFGMHRPPGIFSNLKLSSDGLIFWCERESEIVGATVQ